ncbi:SAM-dependent methyltransferase [Oscillatoriales cyanobacterium USR001]|nr:SAM-dependent methyltransferase [Oscillatoriales cyanobacterium USR001]
MQVVVKMNIESAENPVVRAFIENQVKFPADFRTQICEEDEMYLYSLSNVDNDRDRALVRYYAIGRRILDSIKQIVEWHFDSFENVSSFLDFACGYGRFTRFLIQELPPEKIWVSDIYANAVKFQQEHFNVNGIISTKNPENYVVDRKFDCILACSFFSHMPEKTFVNWMQNLYDLLSPQGLIMFSVLDMELLPPEVPIPPSGIVFSPRSESRYLDKEEYGTTYVTEAYINQVIAQVSDGKAVVHRIPKGISRYQDLYLVSNAKVKDFSSLNFRHHPEGYLEIAYITPTDKINLEGWAADINQDGRLEEVQVLVNGQLMQKCLPFENREDVAQHFKTNTVLNSGWSCYLGRGMVLPDDVVMIKAINNYGLEWIIENCKLQSLLNIKESQTKLLSTEAKLEQTQIQLLSTEEKLAQTQIQLSSTEEKLEQTQNQLLFTQDKLEQTQNRLLSTEEKLAQTEVQLSQTQMQVQIEIANNQAQKEQLQSQILRMQNRIMAMESSKFWKMRLAWFRVKRKIGLAGENE